jgi:hypothetical protein
MDRSTVRTKRLFMVFSSPLADRDFPVVVVDEESNVVRNRGWSE